MSRGLSCMLFWRSCFQTDVYETGGGIQLDLTDLTGPSVELLPWRVSVTRKHHVWPGGAAALRPGCDRTSGLWEKHLLPGHAGVPQSAGAEGGGGEHGPRQRGTDLLVRGGCLRVGHPGRRHGGSETWAQWRPTVLHGVC